MFYKIWNYKPNEILDALKNIIYHPRITMFRKKCVSTNVLIRCYLVIDNTITILFEEQPLALPRSAQDTSETFACAWDAMHNSPFWLKVESLMKRRF